jgi:rod shape-determining protein MreB and related proteins
MGDGLVSRPDLAIDLGSANTLVYQQGRGIVYDEPTVVAMNSRTGQVLDAGRRVWEIVGRSSAVLAAVRPLQRGAVTDFELTQQMVRLILRGLRGGRFRGKPRVLVCVPSVITEVERRAVQEAVSGAGARSVGLLEEPLAAAIGAGLPIHEPVGNLVVDVGGGTTEVGVVAMGGVVAGGAVKVGGFDMDAAIQQHIRKRYGVAIGEMAAERLKIELGSAYPAADARPAEVRGREMATGMPKDVMVSPEEIREALSEPVRLIVESARRCLADSPPELAHDVLETGLFLTGGGAMLRGLDMRIAQECEVPVHVTEQPLATVALGAGHLLDYPPDDGASSSFMASPSFG